MDVTADQLEMVDAQHLAIWRGNVEALQDGNRLVSDVLNVYFSGKPSPGAPAAPAAGGAVGSDWGDVERVVADGHVFYVSKDQTARGDHAVYEAVPDIITMTGNVVLVQGQNVVKGDTLVIDEKTNHANVVSNVQGRNHPERVRGVFYNAKTATAPAAGASAPPPAQGTSPAATAVAPPPRPAPAKP
jgi:lipopolysaccharide export system protein LptA